MNNSKNFIEEWYPNATPQEQRRLWSLYEETRTTHEEVVNQLISNFISIKHTIIICLIIMIIAWVSHAIIYKKSIFVHHRHEYSKGCILLKVIIFSSMIIALLAFVMLMIVDLEFRSMVGVDIWSIY